MRPGTALPSNPSVPDPDPEPDARLSRVGTLPLEDDGDVSFMTAAFGHPQSKVLLGLPVLESEYWGRDVYSRVAKHDRIWNGESMEISKWRRFVPVGSSVSNLERRMTIFQNRLVSSLIINGGEIGRAHV